MAFCGKCGSEVAEGAAFCPKCGAAVGAATAAPAVAVPAAGSGLRENVAGLLCYLLGFITGIVFLLIDKRPFVRFHAAQSIVVFGALFVIRLLLSFGLLGGGYGLLSLWSLLSVLVSLVTVVLWIVLMVKAYQGTRFEIPGAGGLVKSILGSAAA